MIRQHSNLVVHAQGSERSDDLNLLCKGDIQLRQAGDENLEWSQPQAIANQRPQDVSVNTQSSSDDSHSPLTSSTFVPV